MKLIGHTEQFNAVSSFVPDHLNRSFLVTGPPDCGKTFFCMKFGSIILDSAKVFRNTHPDFIMLKGTSAWSEVLNDFQTACLKRPFESKRVVVFLDDIGSMPRTALNKILKIVEEPPELTTIILSSSTKDDILDTIVSRTFEIKLRSRSDDEVKAILFAMGYRDADSRMLFSRSLKTCASRYFDEYRNTAELYRKETLDILNASAREFSKKSYLAASSHDASEFLSKLMYWTDDLEFNQFLVEEINSAKNGGNSFLSLISFFKEVRGEFERLEKKLKI